MRQRKIIISLFMMVACLTLLACGTTEHLEEPQQEVVTESMEDDLLTVDIAEDTDKTDDVTPKQVPSKEEVLAMRELVLELF